MKMGKIANNMRLLSVIGEGKMIDYYLVFKGETYYAFSKKYTTHCHDLCKSGVRVKDLLLKKSYDTGVMKLVSTANRMVPYLIQYYELEVA